MKLSTQRHTSAPTVHSRYVCEYVCIWRRLFSRLGHTRTSRQIPFEIRVFIHASSEPCRIGRCKRPTLARKLPCPPRAFDQAAAELSSTIGALAFSGAALYSISMGIRSANNMDAHDARVAEIAANVSKEAVAVETVKAPAVVVATVATPEPVIDEADIQKRAAEAKSWISAWMKRSEAVVAAQEAAAAAAEERERIEAAHAERVTREQAEAAERKAKEAEERALAAAKAVAAKESEMADLRAKAESQVAQRAQQAREWIVSWKERTAVSSSSTADPAMAAALIKEMTEDAPVGVQKSAPSISSAPSTSVTQSKPEPVVAGVSASPAPTGDATQKASQSTRRVSITAEYENKISSLLSSYEATKQKQREAALRQPKQVVEVSAEEIARATQKTNPVIVFFLRIVAMIQACFAFVKSLLTGNSPSSGSSPVTV
jgi:hypothetical protein